MTLSIAISSWSVHGLLGQVYYSPDSNGQLINQSQSNASALPLLDLPAYIANDGIRVLEICHFHFPSTDDAYLSQLKQALASADVVLEHILIDAGNLSSLDDEQWRADIDMTKGWQEVASKLGANGVRIDCGTEPATPETIQRSASALRELADYGQSLGLHTTTENWRATSIEADDLIAIMQQADRPLNLCLDFGNAEKTSDKIATIQQLMPYATSLHCKANYIDGALDTHDLDTCLQLVKDSDFEGAVSLIYGDHEDEWQNILTLKHHVEKMLL